MNDDCVEAGEFEQLNEAGWNTEAVAEFLNRHPGWAPFYDKQGHFAGVATEEEQEQGESDG